LDARAPAGGFGVPPTSILDSLMSRGWVVAELIHHFTRRYRRVYGVYRSGSMVGRAHYRVQQFVPSVFWHPTENFLVSLRCELPTTLDSRFLAFKPAERPAVRYQLHLDGARRRNGRR